MQMETTLQSLISTLSHKDEPKIFHHFLNHSAEKHTPMLVSDREYQTRYSIVFYDETGQAVFSCEADFQDAPAPHGEGGAWKHTATGGELARFIATRSITLGKIAIFDLDNNLVMTDVYRNIFGRQNYMHTGAILILYDVGFRP